MLTHSPTPWERLRHQLALSGKSPGSLFDDEPLRRAIEECARDARAEHWTVDRFVTRLCAAINDSPVSDRKSHGNSGGGREESDRLIAHFLDWGLTEFFAPEPPELPFR